MTYSIFQLSAFFLEAGFVLIASLFGLAVLAYAFYR